jgi:hypothetical protein
MSLEKQTTIDKIEIVTEFKFIQVRELTKILENDEVISEKYKRFVFNPNDDLNSMPEEVREIAENLWNDEIKNSYNQYLSDSELS